MRKNQFDLLLLLALFFVQSCNGDTPTPKEVFKEERLAFYEWEILKAGMRAYNKVMADSIKMFSNFEDIESAADFYGSLDAVVKHERFPTESNRLKVALANLSKEYETKYFNSINSVKNDDSVISIKNFAIGKYWGILTKHKNDSESENIKTAIEETYNIAASEPYIKCIDEEGSCLKSLVEYLNQKKEEELGGHFDLLKQLGEVVEKDGLVSKVGAIQEIFTLSTSLSIGNWKDYKSKVKNWNDKESEAQIKRKGFPDTSEDCLGYYKTIIKGKKAAPEILCWSEISSERKEEIGKLTKIYQAYKEKKFKEKDLFEKGFNAQLDYFKGHLKLEDFIKDPIPDGLYEWLNKNKITLLIFGFLLLITFISILLFRRYRKGIREENDTVSSDEKGTEKAGSKGGLIGYVPNSAEVENEKITALEEKIRALEEKIDSSNKQNKPIAVVNDIPDVEPVPTDHISPPVPIRIPSYAQRPDGENGFLISNISKETISNFYYELDLGDDETGTFNLVENKDLQLSAAKSADVILQTACDYENMPFEIQTGIITLAKGELKKEDNEWRIIKKTRIKFV